MNTSYQQLLVHMDAGAASRVRLLIAHALASPFGAALQAVYAATSSALAMSYPDPASADLLQRLYQEDDNRRLRSRSLFDAVVAASGMQATWSEVGQEPLADSFAQQALFADLVVLGQRDPASDAAHEVPPDFVASVLAASGKPGLVIPYIWTRESVGRTVVIAWKDTREAARAVAAALPLLQRAQSVHVLSWDQQDARVTGSPLDLLTYLTRHGVRAQWHRQGGAEPDAVGEQLLSRASELDADLLVMGCYGHSRMREWMLGGTSRTVLRSMTLPVLMAH